MINGDEFRNLGFADLGVALACADDLGAVMRAVVREQAIRKAMADTGDSREVVVEALDAMGSMDQEAVLGLTDGEPTTLVDALTRYIRILDEPNGDDEAMVDRGLVVGDLHAILEYPWRDEEALIQLHEGNKSLVLDVDYPDDEHVEIVIGDNRWPVASANHDTHGRAGMQLAEQVARDVHRAVLARVIADRDHHVQLNDAQRRELISFLERPNGSWTGGGRLSVDAVAGGGALIRTRPYQHQRPGPALARQQELADRRHGLMPWCGNDDGPRDAYATPQQVSATDPGDLPAQG